MKEARSRATSMLAAIRRGETAPARPEEALFEAVAETVFRQHGTGLEAGHAPREPGAISKDRSCPASPGGPSRRSTGARCVTGSPLWPRPRPPPTVPCRSSPSIMRGAEAAGLRPEGSNPCRGIRRYRRKGRERFLSDDEIHSLSRVLAACVEEAPGQVAAIRLLLLTGCRKSELLTLRWSDYREGRLFLRDSKTGPRTVWLSQPARDILDGIERTGAWVFPSPRAAQSRCTDWLDNFWWRIRADAGLDDVRLHDLRHSHASIALRLGETVLAIGRLLGHADPETTLKYTHAADATVMQAAETVGAVLGAE